MIKNTLKQALKQDKAVFGTIVHGPVSLPVLRTLAGSGAEWLFMDLEHGSLDISQLLEAVQAADLLGIPAVPRLPDLCYDWVARSLDTGALSVMIPRVETAAQAAQAVQWAKFPPVGVRGMGSPSVLSYAAVATAEAVIICNAETLVALQIESRLGVENVEAIAAVPGVDVLFIGPVDLSISLGHPGEVSGEANHAAFRRICGAARARGLAVGIYCTVDNVAAYYQMGMRMFAVGSALGFMAAGATAVAQEFRQQIESAQH